MWVDILSACMSLWEYHIRSSGTGVADNGELPCGCWESTQALLTAEPSLQTPSLGLFFQWSSCKHLLRFLVGVQTLIFLVEGGTLWRIWSSSLEIAAASKGILGLTWYPEAFWGWGHCLFWGSFVFLSLLWIKPRSLLQSGTHSTTEIYPYPRNEVLSEALGHSSSKELDLAESR